MDIELAFRKINRSKKYWTENERLLLAISGGVDSMILLEFFHRLPQTEKPDFAVAHVNHQLRASSEIEERYLQEYCEERKIPFYSQRWSEGPSLKKDIENQARQFRYHFFSEIMEQKDYDSLITAHHQDDQSETILMKLIKGSQLHNLVGIRAETVINNQKIIRPFLSFSKEELERNAKENQLVYFNDETNGDDTYLRNRIRHQVIPLLKEENPQFLAHISHFTTQISYANEIIAEKIDQLFPVIITENQEAEWRIQLPLFLQESESTQYMLLVRLFQKALISRGIVVSNQQQEAALAILRSEKPQQQSTLQAGWYLYKEYTQAFLRKETISEEVSSVSRTLALNQGVFLNEREWLGLYEEGQVVLPAESNELWQKTEIVLSSSTLLPLTVRKFENGDAFIFNEKGQKKKVSRYFIDQKMTNQNRRDSWILTDKNRELIWIVPYKNSYLSIPKETAKIHYRLIYLKNK